VSRVEAATLEVATATPEVATATPEVATATPLVLDWDSGNTLLLLVLFTPNFQWVIEPDTDRVCTLSSAASSITAARFSAKCVSFCAAANEAPNFLNIDRL
jgi:hypothetical protein